VLVPRVGSTMFPVPHGYITTRPASLYEVTSKNLRDCGFRDSPLLLRPSQVAYADTIRYKKDALSALRALLDGANLHDIKIYYVDDYRELIDQINHLHKGIVGVHFDEDSSWNSILNAAGLSLTLESNT